MSLIVSPHSSAIPIWQLKLVLGSGSPKPLESDGPLGPHHLDTYYLIREVVTSEIVRMAADDSSDTVTGLIIDPEKEGNQVNASSFDHNTLNEPVMADDIDSDDLYTFERNLLAGQATNVDLPSNGVVTSNESDDHREIDMRNFVEIAARRRLSISSESN